MKNKYILLLGFATVLLLNSCTYRLIDFTTISSKNVTLNLPDNAKGNRVKGEHFVTVFLGIPWGTPNLKEATDRAIESANGNFDALIDGVVYQKRQWFVLFGRFGYVVEGTPIQTKFIGSNMPYILPQERNVVVNQATVPNKKVYVEEEQRIQVELPVTKANVDVVETVQQGSMVLFEIGNKSLKGKVLSINGVWAKIEYKDSKGNLKTIPRMLNNLKVINGK